MFDDAVSDAVVIDGLDNRLLLADTTDYLFVGSMALRFVDSIFAPIIGHGAWDVALQMSMIDLQAFGLVAAVLWTTQTFVGRARPLVTRRCADPEFSASERKCDPESPEHNRCFIAGHPAVGITAASLTCLHHSHLPLYGGGAADQLVCGLAIGAAVVNGAGRVMTEQHYASDLVLGTALGLFAGYVVPSALHYGFGSGKAAYSARTPGAPRTHAFAASVVPLVSDRRIGAALAGRY